MPVSLKVKSIGALKHILEDFPLITIYIPGIDKKGREVYASISCKLHLFNRLKANILVGNKVLYTESFAINLSTSSALIYSCGVKININARQYSMFLRYRALASALIIIPPCSEVLVAFQYFELPDTRDFSFYPSLQQYFTLYFYFLNHTSTRFLVRNNVNHPIKISLCHQLDCVTKLLYKYCFATSIDLDVASTSLTLPTIFYDRKGISILPADNLEIKFPNGIKIYGNKETVDTITRLVDKYLLI